MTTDILAPVHTRDLYSYNLGVYSHIPDRKATYATHYTPEGVRVEYLGTVGIDYNVVQMQTLTDAMEQRIDPSQAKVTDYASRNGAYVARRYVWGETNRHYIPYAERRVGTTVGLFARISTSFDGSSATRIGWGTIDMWCTNGCVAYNSSMDLSVKHTKNATPQKLVEWIDREHKKAQPIMMELYNRMVLWGKIKVTVEQAEELITQLPNMSERLAHKMIERVHQEIADRGAHLFSVASAFTYYSNHNEEFAVRKTKQDNVAETLQLKREAQVQQWLASDAWKQLEAA